MQSSTGARYNQIDALLYATDQRYMFTYKNKMEIWNSDVKNMPKLNLNCDCGCNDIDLKDITDIVKNLGLELLSLFNNAKKTASPIALDLDGDGVESYGPDNSSVVFDLDGDGSKNITGWVNSDDGLLVWDRNNNGLIDNGGELFGENTLKYGGNGELCADGWEALAQEDTNGDSVINSLDANWSKLKVWRDLNPYTPRKPHPLLF